MKSNRRYQKLVKLFLILTIVPLILNYTNQSTSVEDTYTKYEYNIPMRDGIKLFTSVYVPKDDSKKYPIMMMRTPYSVRPYGKDKYKKLLGPSPHFQKDKFIFVYQDVRGKYMSEGEYVNMRPYIPNKKGNEIDETTDTYDTVEWLIKNISNNNGKVGIWGISYPGFYAAMSTIDAHPAIDAVSPQAPIADWFIGDDMHHNGALSLPLSFNFFSGFGQPRSKPTAERSQRFKAPSPDAYSFFLDMGPLKNANEKYLKYTISFWNDFIKHSDYDEFWQSRNTLPHFNNINPAVMTVGGWFDGEDLYGSLNTYKSIEEKNPNAYNIKVIGPWRHGGWARGKGNSFGIMEFNSNTSEYYQSEIEFPFFKYYLKDEAELNLPDVSIFKTGENKWYSFEIWPPANAVKKNLYFHSNESLSFNTPSGTENDKFDQYVSDPNRPVPYTDQIIDSRRFYFSEYVVGDQRFASYRQDVLIYESDTLQEDITIAGSITAELYVSTTGTDADWIVKVIDVYPDDEPNPNPNPDRIEMGGYQMMIRGDIFRGKYRNSFEEPESFVPNEVTKVVFDLQDVFHLFKKGHKIMVQVQSSWFPLYDRNPQKFCDIYNADEEDFQKATHRVYFTEEYPSNIRVNFLNQ